MSATENSEPAEELALSALALVKTDLFKDAPVGSRLTLHLGGVKHNDTQLIENELFVTASDGSARVDLDDVRERSRVMAGNDRRLKSELVAVRRIRGFTQQDVADLLGIPVEKVHKFESYDSDPRSTLIRSYANVIGAVISHQVTLAAPQSSSGGA